jgi:hypothetical protein
MDYSFACHNKLQTADGPAGIFNASGARLGRTRTKNIFWHFCVVCGDFAIEHIHGMSFPFTG